MEGKLSASDHIPSPGVQEGAQIETFSVATCSMPLQRYSLYLCSSMLSLRGCVVWLCIMLTRLFAIFWLTNCSTGLNCDLRLHVQCSNFVSAKGYVL